MTQRKEENIKNDYLQGMRYKDIFKKYNITLPDLKKIIRKYNLTRDKSQVLKGNKMQKITKVDNHQLEIRMRLQQGNTKVYFKMY